MQYRPENRMPDWRNIAAVLEKRAPSRPTLFELFLDDALIRAASGITPTRAGEAVAASIRANDRLGYDYVIQTANGFHYPFLNISHGKTISLNESPSIVDRASFDAYPWPDPAAYGNELIDAAKDSLPDGMKLMIWIADGLLETVIRMLGYENLCLLLYDDEPLVSDVFERVGAGYLEYFKRCVDRPEVMALISSDDWGFNTQTMLAPATLRKYVFPWQRAYVRLAHSHGKYALLHSCGTFKDILDDILDIGFDARHSYEDAIIPVEAAYENLCGRLAVLGGIDMDFLTREGPEAVKHRASAMLDRAAQRGGYALGSGNSIADYVPLDNYFAMTACAFAE